MMTLQTPMSRVRPQANEYYSYYDTYVSKVPDGDIIEILTKQQDEIRAFYERLPAAQVDVLHPPYTWSIKQATGHLIDGERIFADRLHRFAMGDPQPQPGMDQDIYVSSTDYAIVDIQSLVEELLHCRQANVLLLKRLSDEAWSRRGEASGYGVTVRALAWMLAGHVIHHMRVFEKRIA